jgi:hypothetical protein
MDNKSLVSHSKSLFLLMVIAAFALPVSAKSPIYRCVKDGQTVLTDKPCEDTTPEPSSGAAGTPSQASESVVGQWRGQAQFQGAQNGQLIEEAHNVVPLVLTLSVDGKVSGTSPDNGCELLGLWAPGSTPRLFSLDVTLSGGRYTGFNRRYTGTLIATFPENSAQIALQADTLPIPGIPVRRYDVGATLRR